jgi:hypothetical protein
MASKPQVQCPLCHLELDDSEHLQDHLVESHSSSELAEAIVSRWEATEYGYDS